MSAPTPTVAALRAHAEAARLDLMGTLSEIQTRLNPREVVRSAIDNARSHGEDLAGRGVDAARTAVAVARDTGEDIAERGVEFARAKPGAAAGIAAAAVALVAHRPILRGLRALFRRDPAKPEPVDTTPALTKLYSDLGASV